MNTITLDFETYYDKDYSIKKLTTEEYIRSDQFEVIGVGVKVNDGETEWASGSMSQIRQYLGGFEWGDSMVIAHNTPFDGAILGWKFGITAKVWVDTLSMARAIHSIEVGGSLAKLAEHYKLGIKGTEVVNALGKRRADFTALELSAYGDYCINDVELTYALFKKMASAFSRSELKLIDQTLRMFIEPALELDVAALQTHYSNVVRAKEELLTRVGLERETLTSDAKFAAALQDLGVTPPVKISKTTNKVAYAFAKTDEEFLALQEHPNVEVQALVAARLGNKSTLEESRTMRFIDIGSRADALSPLLPVPIKYYAAHTGRWGGDEKINLQNLPSRGNTSIKSCIRAPIGHVIVDCDSSQIEARVLAWLAEQWDLVDLFEKNNEEIAAGVPKEQHKYDPYKEMASVIYGKEITDINKDERFVGKTAILGAGYGMGAPRFADQVLTQSGVILTPEMAHRSIKVYRSKNSKIYDFWGECSEAIRALHTGRYLKFGRNGLMVVDPDRGGIVLPNNLVLKYPDLQMAPGDKGPEYTYKTRKGRTKIYGGKLTENICQALARIIIGHQMLKIAADYKVALTVHDSLVCVVPEPGVKRHVARIEQCMRSIPDWAEGLPISCESHYGRTYG